MSLVKESSTQFLSQNKKYLATMETLKDFNRNGNKVKEVKKETNNAKAVNKPKRTVGVKLDRAKIENPAAIVVAV